MTGQQSALAGSVAVVRSPDDLESLEETLDILSQPGALVEIGDSAADIVARRTVSIEDIRAEFGRPLQRKLVGR
ncbi:MAG: hypothetical protein M3332_12170 [Actinomycetota bacterium]|nr:hypothetical protein [Actinomycetota bacterium]